MLRPSVACLLIGLAALFIGCSGREPTYPVTGKVLYKGEGTPAVSGIYVVFESTKDPYPRAMGKINTDGSFTLSTDRPDNGAIQGPHRICIQPTSADGAGMDLTPQISKKIDPKYFEFRTSGLTYDIKPGENKDILVEVERPK
jgi:hypothetical protein